MTMLQLVGYTTMWLHVVLSSFRCPEIRAAVPKTNAMARAELCYNSLASPTLSLQATSAHISSLHEHVTAQKLVRPWSEQPDQLRRPWYCSFMTCWCCSIFKLSHEDKLPNLEGSLSSLVQPATVRATNKYVQIAQFEEVWSVQ